MKKICFMLLLLLLGISPILAAPCGDVNSDGQINIVDALMTAQYYVGIVPSGYDVSAGDVSGDGIISIVDALQTAQYAVELISSFAGCATTPTPKPTPADPNSPRYPFPQNVVYPYGVMSDTVSSDYVKQYYDNWRRKYLRDCNGNLMTSCDSADVAKVEAMGWAMMAAAYMGDKEVVDGLYDFYQTKVTSSACGMMAWNVSCSGISDSGSATDGDIDFACGLLVAHWQWPTLGYDVKLRNILDKAEVLITVCNGVYSIAPGCGGGRPYGGCQETDISYYEPAFFRYFADITGNAAWTRLADDTIKILNAAAHPVTGMVPDWQTVNGSNYTGGRNTTYRYDAIRTSFKTGLDYLWNGTPAVKDWCVKLTSWLYSNVGVKNIVDGYALDGRKEGSYHNLAHLGSLAVCACANTQQIADAYVSEAGSLVDNYWYGDYLGNVYLLAISGNMWNPDIVN